MVQRLHQRALSTLGAREHHKRRSWHPACTGGAAERSTNMRGKLGHSLSIVSYLWIVGCSAGDHAPSQVSTVAAPRAATPAPTRGHGLESPTITFEEAKARGL